MTTRGHARARVGLIGARGYVGRELLAILARHPHVEIALVTSQKDAGRSVADDVPALAGSTLVYEAPEVERQTALGLDAVFLALPNGTSDPWVSALARARPDAVLIDLSADHRFDDGWVYGQPERNRAAIRGARRIANPGCYATAIQLALAPVTPLQVGAAHAFGVSGYSGAGTTPSPRSDPANLADNLIPYALTGHVHEREVTRHLGRPVFFMPHVAPFFRGITVTVSFELAPPPDAGAHDVRAIARLYEEAYETEPLVHFGADAPLVRDVRGRHEVFIGGLSMAEDGRHGVVVATIDNLLGGAATQAVRNLNLALGLDERAGIIGATDGAPAPPG